MKKSLLILAAIFLFSTVTTVAQSKTSKDLIGKWEGTDERNDNGSLQFLDSSKVVMTMMGEKMPTALYKADFSQTPVLLDIIIDQRGQKFVMKSLIQFLDDSRLKWQVFPDGNRPKDFSDNSFGTAVILKRK